jgi:NADPH-dependent ferric siderophore reductase
MTDPTSPIEVVQHPFVFRLLEVVRSEQLTPHMVRVIVGGDQLAGFRSDAADDGARLFFPPDPTAASWVPRVEGSSLVFPGERPPGREYTPRAYDPAAGELAFDFVVHGDGPASTWARNAAPGHYLGCSGPRRSRLVVGRVDWYVLAGDETAIPAIARRLEGIPAGTPVVAVLEVADAGEEQPLPAAADLQVIWLHRADAAPDDTGQLARTLATIPLPAGDGFAWAAGEATAMRAVRRHWLQERGIPDTRMRVTGYWKRTIPNYDHHLPLDADA